MLHPADTAFRVIDETMRRGSRKDGRHDNWRHKLKAYHLTKGLRHATTALMIDMGIIAPDGENHAELALTRFAMALTVQPEDCEEYHQAPVYPPA